MERTQIYLTEQEKDALDRAASATGLSRSQLIRDAIEAIYLKPRDASTVEETLRSTAGSWRRRREDGAAYVERSRSGRLARIHGR